ncbi:Ku protein [soil metagenome]
MRSIWNGSIGFGLVNIPVKLYSASQQNTISLDMLDKKDHAKIKYKRVNENTQEEVDWNDIIKGYKLDDEYIIITDEDFEKANAKKSKIIEITEFVNEKDIDSIYYDKPYFLEPEKNGAKAYALLREALKKSKKAGIATFVLRNKENLSIIKPMGDGLILNKIRFQSEVRDIDQLNLPPKLDIKGKELDMAISLIEQYTTDFDIAAYKDSYTEELMNLIEEKSKGKKTKVKKLEVAPTKAQDLMSQLKASLEQSKRKAS